MGSRRKTPPRIPTEEFSIEFGDINGIKLYEVLQQSSQKESKKIKNKPAE